MEPGPYDGSDQANLTDLEFVWDFEDYNSIDNTLSLQINFTNAVSISPNLIKDNLFIEFNNPNVFRSLEFGRTFENQDREVYDGVKK